MKKHQLKNNLKKFCFIIIAIAACKNKNIFKENIIYQKQADDIYLSGKKEKISKKKQLFFQTMLLHTLFYSSQKQGKNSSNDLTQQDGNFLCEQKSW